MVEPSKGTLRFSGHWILNQCFRYSSRHSHFCLVHASFQTRFNLQQNAPLPILVVASLIYNMLISHSFGRQLSPIHCRRKSALPVSYYALFKGWLLLSKPPGCLPLDNEAYPPLSHWLIEFKSSILSLPRFGTAFAARTETVLYP